MSGPDSTSKSGGGGVTSGGGELTTPGDDDAVWVAKARRGDADAFGELVTRHRRRAYQVAMGMLGHPETAMDLTQEAFLRAYQSLDRFRGEAAFFTWLRRIVTNVCLDHLRKAEHRTPTTSYDEALGGDEDPDAVGLAGTLEAPDTGVRRKELGAAIEAAMKTLTPEQRAAVVLREVEGLSYEEIAKVLECATGTVMSRLHYARKRLQALLREHHEG